MSQQWTGKLEKIDDYHYRIPKSYKPGMRVDGIIFANETLMEQITKDQAPEQVANVASLPGIVGHSLAMPDIHWGYGFPIGGVAATDPEHDGVISPGGVGYDINCGVRLIRTNLAAKQVRDRLEELVNVLFRIVPTGVGRGGKYKFDHSQLRQIITRGAAWAIEQGYGQPEDRECTEGGGYLEGADPDALSHRAYQRGVDQCGTLGSGNHFLELQFVDKVYEPAIAEAWGLTEGQVTVMIHSGSRGLGYQVCDDAIRELRNAPARYGIDLPDRQLVCAPVHSKEGQKYLAAMRGAANFAWANRQMLMHLTRKALMEFFRASKQELGLELIYDVAHNIAKMETYPVDGRQRMLCVHRKGATRAFPAGHQELPARYRQTGQPVLIPGDMGRYSFVLVGQQGAMEQTFGSTCHGAGRMLSRKAAIQAAKGRSISKELRQHGIVAKARDRQGLDEEQPDAYKDVSDVVDAVEGAGLSRKVCRLHPLGVIKG